MEIQQLPLAGTYQITLSPIGDSRGFFMRTFDVKAFNHYGLNKVWVQENHSRSSRKGILRGLHFQFPPYCETKLVRCIRGSVRDVFVDLRQDSPTFGKWDSIDLSEDNKKMVYIPRGFAHGFCTLSENSEVLYKVDNYYAPNHEGGLRWNDPQLNIEWPLENPILSEKDQHHMSLQEFIANHKAIAQS